MNRRAFITRLAGLIGLGAVGTGVAEPVKAARIGEESHAMSTSELLPHEYPDLTAQAIERMWADSQAIERLGFKAKYAHAQYGIRFPITEGAKLGVMD